MAKKTTITSIKRHNKAAGYHFFGREAMEHWGSQILPKVYEGPGGVFFVSSEQSDYDPQRMYNVRVYDPQTGRCATAHRGGTAAPVYRGPSKDEAVAVAAKLAQG